MPEITLDQVRANDLVQITLDVSEKPELLMTRNGPMYAVAVTMGETTHTFLVPATMPVDLVGRYVEVDGDYEYEDLEGLDLVDIPGR